MNGKNGFPFNGPSSGSGASSGFSQSNLRQMTPGAAINQLLFNKKNLGMTNGQPSAPFPGSSQAQLATSFVNGESAEVHRNNGMNGSASSIASDDSFESETPSSVDVPSTSNGSTGSKPSIFSDGSEKG